MFMKHLVNMAPEQLGKGGTSFFKLHCTIFNPVQSHQCVS